MPPFQQQPFPYVLQSRWSEKLHNIHRKHLRWSHFLLKLQCLRPATLLKRNSNKGVNIALFLRTAFFIEHFRRLLRPFITTFRNYYWKDRLITINKDHVNSTPEKHLKNVLGILQVVKKEMQSLLLTFSIFLVMLQGFCYWLRF